MSDLLKRIASGESQILDFKFRIDDQNKIARTLGAFSNSDGGSLLIGVKDNGKVAGCNPEEEFYMIQGAAEMSCQPPVDFDSRVWQEKHHLVLEIFIARGTEKVKCKDENGKWVAYYRINDSTVRGNKVLDKLWALNRVHLKRPEKFSEREIDVIRKIHELGPVSLSKLNKITALGFDPLSKLIAALIHWKVVEIKVDEEGLRYYCSDFQD